MKNYYHKDINAFLKKCENGTNWNDEMKIDGKIYRIYEYGGGSLMKLDHDYVYFYNKRNRTMIYIKYHLPSVNYVNGEKIVSGYYQFISGEVIENAEEWR